MPKRSSFAAAALISAHERCSDVLVLRHCRQAAARAILAGSLAGCGHPTPVVEPTTPPEANEPAALAPPDDEVEPKPETPRRKAEPMISEDWSVRPPLLPTDEPNVVSSSEREAFPCGGIPHPDHASDEDEAIIRRRMEAFDQSRFNVPARGLHVAEATDFVQIYQVVVDHSHIASEPGEIRSERFLQAGIPCANAADQDACRARLDALREQTAQSFTCSRESCRGELTTYALVTQGDDVRLLKTPKQFRAWLGPIDTPVEAWLMLMAQRELPILLCDPLYATHRAVPGGIELGARKATSYCVIDVSPATAKDFVYRVDRQGNAKRLSSKLVYSESRCVVSGRRPPGLLASDCVRDGSAGELFARMAELEYASIAAFRRLGRELAALGAPRALRTRLRQAARDEIAHTRTMRELARSHGAEMRKPAIRATARRGALELAQENAREGCVREMFGALVAHFQAERAEDVRVREVFSVIAEDEARHAALALDLHAFLGTQLDAHERAEVDRVRAAAQDELRHELAEPTDAERRVCGLPTQLEARVLLSAVATATSWS